MNVKTNYITPDIKLVVVEDELFKKEAHFEHHILVWFISGEAKIIQAGATHVFTAGDIFTYQQRLPGKNFEK